MKIMQENDYGEILAYQIKNGIVQFYFIDANGKKSKTKTISIDYLIGATF